MPEVAALADYPTIIAGTDWDDLKYHCYDDATGETFDWEPSTDRWVVVAEIRDRSGELLARLASSGERDGLITRHTDGRLTFFLGAAITAGLPITRTYAAESDPRIGMTWRHTAAHAFDVIATDTDNDTTTALISGFVTVQQSVTEEA